MKVHWGPSDVTLEMKESYTVHEIFTLQLCLIDMSYIKRNVSLYLLKAINWIKYGNTYITEVQYSVSPEFVKGLKTYKQMLN
jgi:hypothetical protein